MECKTISLQSKKFEKEMKRIIKKNNGVGYTKLLTIMNIMKKEGKTNDEILSILQEM